MVLAVLNVIAPQRQALWFSWHLSLVTIAVLGVYVYRDIWPMMTFTLHPLDGAEGNILLAKIALAAVTGVALPLFEPYPYIPYDKNVSLKHIAS